MFIGVREHVAKSLLNSIASFRRSAADPDVICFSHLRWNFVFQRPQHLLTRCARERRVFFFEEPVFDAEVPRLDTTCDPSGVVVAVPHLPGGQNSDLVTRQVRALADELIALERIDDYVAWYYTPMALSFSRHLQPAAIVYDCMDELSAFAGAPQGLRDAERALLAAADVVFTGGQSLYEAKRHLHGNAHAFPSSVDVAHFARARRLTREPADQAAIARPRLGFFGVIDERFDLDLLRAAAAERPDWNFMLIGPVVKIDPATLPQGANIHYLGPKAYAELPDYMAGWDVALLPFARNESTRFISPTKTPEYLAAGLPVVSTSIRDVVRPYGDRGLVRIADTPAAFVAAIDAALHEDRAARLKTVDPFLAKMSWDTTWQRMWQQIEAAITSRSESATMHTARREPAGRGTSAPARA
jgi:glycosyltransferase involved in cell wall biosynthesis